MQESSPTLLILGAAGASGTSNGSGPTSARPRANVAGPLTTSIKGYRLTPTPRARDLSGMQPTFHGSPPFIFTCVLVPILSMDLRMCPLMFIE